MKIFKLITAILLLLACVSLLSKAAPETAGKDDISVTSKGGAKVVLPDLLLRVHRAGILWMSMTNNGCFGNPESLRDPCTGKTAVNGELPGGTGTDFIFVGSLLFGGYLDSTTVTIPNGGGNATLFQGPLVTTSDEGWSGVSGRRPRECWAANFVNPVDSIGVVNPLKTKITEWSNVEGKLSCLFEEVYDPAATAEEQFNIYYTDKYIDEDPYTGQDEFDKRQHIPLGIEISQRSYAWSYDYAQKFIIIDYTLTNLNDEGKDIYDFFMGVYLDCDIGMKGVGDWVDNHADDLGGFIEKWDKYIDPATNQLKTVDLNLAWSADNDGRNYTGQDFYTGGGQPGAGAPLDGATSIATVRVLRNPNPNLRYSYNMYVANSTNEAIDWGPRWQTGFHDDWQYDMTPMQKGYDDTNHDLLHQDADSPSAPLLYGGRTEGRPCGDRGKYMLMSNDEFDYNQTAIREVYKGYDTQMDGTPIPQSDKWQKYTTINDIGSPGFSEDIADGTIRDLNELANGADTKYILSFGPLGTETAVDVAVDRDGDQVYESKMPAKKVWKFSHGESLRLTLAFIVNENFHTSLDQDPNYADIGILDLEDGINPDYYSKGWYDALYNVIWAERVYDIPMFDTFTTKNGVKKSDGWYGEDVGADAIFGDIENSPTCWWLSTPTDYTAPDTDGSEGDNKVTNFTSSITDIYGHEAISEDELLPFGRETASSDGDYGITGDPANGDKYGYGYMVKYDKTDGNPPQGTWIRFGYKNGKLDAGDGVPDFTGPPPPPSPKISASYSGKDIIVEWMSHEFIKTEEGYDAFIGPEHFIDPFSRNNDFEGYQIHLSPDENQQNYVEIFSVDKVNYVYEDRAETGKYLDTPITEKEYLNLVLEGQSQIMSQGKIYYLKKFGDNRSLDENHKKPGFFNFEVKKDSINLQFNATLSQKVYYSKYRFTLYDKLYGKQNYIAVTSSDYGDPKSGTPALQSSPPSNAKSVTPGSVPGTNKVYVVPNPYRGDVDYEAMGVENTVGNDDWEEQDRKIIFFNVPDRSVLRIFTLAGDLVKTIGHNGNARQEERYMAGPNGISWDLINDNNQAVASGIYIFSIKDVDDDSFEEIGKFVIIK